MKKIIISVFAIFSLLLMSCSGDSTKVEVVNEKGNTFKLECNIDNAPAGKVFLEKINGQNFVTKQTLDIENNSEFSFEGDLEGDDFYRVRFYDGKFFFLVLSPKTIKVSADANDVFSTLKFEGSNDSQIFNDFVLENSKRTTKLQQMQAEYQQRMMAGDQTAQVEFQEKYNEIVIENNQFLKDIIDNNLSSIIAPYLALSLDVEEHYAYLKDVSARISENQSNVYANNLSTMIGSVKALAIGEPAPEIELPDPNGNTLKLSDYKGKIVLIDFWASWCRPCRAENPNVVKMYSKYKNKDFEIFGVSLDKSKDAWVKAIENDGITWPQVSDLQFWNCAAAKTYQVKGIPQTYLIDKEGKILAKNLRGTALESKLAEVLN